MFIVDASAGPPGPLRQPRTGRCPASSWCGATSPSSPTPTASWATGWSQCVQMGVEDHLRRPAPDLVGRACRLLAARPPRHRRRGGHGHAQRHHRRGPVRPRVRGVAGPTASRRWPSAWPTRRPSGPSAICERSPPTTIRGAARLIATASSCACQWGLAFEQQIAALGVTESVADIMAITGNIDNPGGNALYRCAFLIEKRYGLGDEYIVQARPTPRSSSRPDLRHQRVQHRVLR